MSHPQLIAPRVDRILREIEGVAAQFGIDTWERNFLASIRGRGCLTEKQEARLQEIEQKVFHDAADDEEA